MNTVVIRQGITQITDNIRPGKPVAALCLFALFFVSETTAEVISSSLYDAYLQVSVFVAATLAGLFFFEKVGRKDLESFLNRNTTFHVPIAASLGALPGCGGAIVVCTQFVRGSISFGGLVAVLCATMGDAAFLLLARDPVTAVLVFATCYGTGIVSGFVVDLVHGRNFCRVKCDYNDGEEEIVEENILLTPLYKLWMALFVPGAIFGVLIAFQYDPAAISRAWLGSDLVTPLALLAAGLSIALWMVNPLSDFRLYTSRKRTLARRIADTTNFVTFWVIVGFVGYALLENVFAVDIGVLFTSWGPLLPLIGILIGFVPGCGPQVVVTTLYLNGYIPLSALLGNAISNDGDALFPAIAAAPKAAALATLYTAVPALLIGYGYYFLFE